jgi:signal peptide peptidase SppA
LMLDSLMTMNAFARDIAFRLHHRGALIERGHADVAAELRDIAVAELAAIKASFPVRMAELVSSYGYQEPVQAKPFAYASGVAFIPVHGLLVNRMSWSASFATGYDFIRAQTSAALADDDVKQIVYDVNSSGGLAAGCAELADFIYEKRGQKPSLAVVDSRCYSAAYFLASAADRVVVTPSGGVGSIGCVAVHVDFSQALENEGVKLTFIHEGAEKVDGNSYEPLSPRARESIQRDVSYHYGLFVEAVARHRGLSEDEVRATEARCYLPPEALELGLIDGIKTPVDAVSEKAEPTMTDPVMTAADVSRLVAEGIAQGLAAERSRSAAIRTCTEATGRENLAAHLAEATSLSVDEARAILAAAGKPEAGTDNPRQTPSGFAAAMDASQNPNVGADPAAGDGGGDDSTATANRLLNNYAAASGRKIRAAA